MNVCCCLFCFFFKLFEIILCSAICGILDLRFIVDYDESAQGTPQQTSLKNPWIPKNKYPAHPTKKNAPKTTTTRDPPPQKKRSKLRLQSSVLCRGGVKIHGIFGTLQKNGRTNFFKAGYEVSVKCDGPGHFEFLTLP